MLLNYELTTNLKINTLMDLNKLKQLEDSSNLKQKLTVVNSLEK